MSNKWISICIIPFYGLIFVPVYFFKQTYSIMPENPCTHRQNTPKVLYETVAFRYSKEGIATLVGEAEIMIETFGDAIDSNANLYAVRVDILSAFAPAGCDVYDLVMADPALRQEVEKVALLYYFHPPEESVKLPGLGTEW